jgi:hypothetical protein
MNPRELVDHIRSGPAKLELVEPLRFRRRTRSNPCDFNEFLRVLQSSETIRFVECWSHRELEIAEDEWVLLIKTLGRIKDIQKLELRCRDGSHDFHPFQAIAEAVNNAPRSLRTLEVEPGTFPINPSGLTGLANALREHTTLQEFGWFDAVPQMEAERITYSVDPVLRALPACSQLQKVTIMTKCASADAMKNLLQLQSAANLRLVLKHVNWLAVADEIRRGRCNVQNLSLFMLRPVTISEATEAVKAVASAIRMDQNLEHLILEMQNGFTDEAGVALAEALTVNKTLRKITVSARYNFSAVPQNKANLGAQAYEAFSSMLRVNTSLVLELPSFESGRLDGRLCESRKQMIIEQRLNEVGRGRLLSSSQATKEEWVDALHEMNSYDSAADDSPTFQIGCLYSLLRLHPAVCMSS